MFEDLKPGKHLLLDNTVFGDVYRLRRVVHQPRRDPATPVMLAREKWEGAYVTPLCVMRDAVSGRFRMWYQAHDTAIAAERKSLKTSRYGNVGPPQPIYLCYAESADGIDWERAKIGLYDHRLAGQTHGDGGANGICFKGFSEAAGNTIIDRAELANAPAFPPERRYVLVNQEWFDGVTGGVIFAYSPDGLRWSYPPRDQPGGVRAIHGESDTWNCLVWNAERRVYMLYMRAWHSAAIGWPNGKGNPRRRVAYAESADLLTWSEPQVILSPDELDTNDFYGFQVFRYADRWLGMLWIYDDDDDETIEAELVWSDDGVRWSRHPERPRFLATARPDSDEFMIIPSQQPIAVDDELWMYYTAHTSPHGVDGREGARAYRTKLRLDGFVSLSAGLPMGNLVTRPFTITTPAIEINARTFGGEIVAELVEPWWQEPQGKPIGGFAAKDFDVFDGDSARHRLCWRGVSDLSSLRGRRVLLRLSLKRAEIFSITI